MVENQKNAVGVSPLTDSSISGVPVVGHGMNSINNNTVMQGVKGVHGQPSNVGVGGDGITTVSINPAMNSPTGSTVEATSHVAHSGQQQQHLGGDGATSIGHPAKAKGNLSFILFRDTRYPKECISWKCHKLIGFKAI